MGAERRDPALGPVDAYRPPSANLEFADAAAPEAVAIREAHIGHERQLKSVGLLFGLAAFALLTSGVMLALNPTPSGPSGDLHVTVEYEPAYIAFLLVVGLGCGVMAWGYATLASWIRFVGTPISLLGLLAVPVGTLIHAYILYLIWCEKGRRVLAPDYAAIIRATPQVRYKRTVGDWIALTLLLLLVVGLAAMVLFA
ncbi:hypothetical protein [Silanimonas sp.]|uniref:hypothetical protein n=1 Tax=Silanimonas sp. TaxID=1929290 RepID=UPI0022CB9512|nr:hypothetical protein [Silanimonas sp.]MCZ8114981.1 hypothetical protein [Silanimonas sp.]